MSLITDLQAASDEPSCRALTQRLLTDLFAGTLAPAAIFSNDYQQHTDGNALNYAEFVRHLDHVRTQTKGITFRVEQACCTPHLLADRHIVTVSKTDGQTSEIEVYLFARLREGKIWRIDEVTRVIKGDHADKSLASATS